MIENFNSIKELKNYEVNKRGGIGWEFLKGTELSFNKFQRFAEQRP
jgi:hypothetical protein